jgi:hypothetical protein
MLRTCWAIPSLHHSVPGIGRASTRLQAKPAEAFDKVRAADVRSAPALVDLAATGNAQQSHRSDELLIALSNGLDAGPQPG